jgi:hypothetical protein
VDQELFQAQQFHQPLETPLHFQQLHQLAVVDLVMLTKVILVPMADQEAEVDLEV